MTTTNDPRDPLSAAISDLATRLGVDPGRIHVESRQEVTWRDGSLGCPKPGMRYTQALVNGYRIVLDCDGKSYAYHGAGGRLPFLCERPADRGALSLDVPDDGKPQRTT